MPGTTTKADDDGLLELAQHVAELWRCLREFSRASEDMARRHGLTPQQYRMMIMVKGAPDGGQMATVGELHEQLHLAQSTVTELVDRADAAGLVVRQAATEDARRTEVRLTREGERRLKAAMTELAAERRTFARLVAELRELI